MSDWINWDGSKDFPGHPATKVEVKRRDRRVEQSYAGGIAWHWSAWSHSVNDVVAYRVVEEPELVTLHTLTDASAEWAEALDTSDRTHPDSGVVLKDTNPKDAIGNGKLDMGLVPDTAVAYLAMALTEGALKYGRYNWRIAGVRASIYHAALKRHLAKWWNGEWADEKTNVPHLASVLACAAILVDARECAKLTDDRPPSAPLDAVCGYGAGMTLDLQALFKDFEPHQYTIADDEVKG